MDQVLQLVGAIMVLSGFVGTQAHLLEQRSYPYLVLNFVGSAILAYLAWHERQWGFLLLEGVWAIVSLAGLGAWVVGRNAPTGRQREEHRDA